MGCEGLVVQILLCRSKFLKKTSLLRLVFYACDLVMVKQLSDKQPYRTHGTNAIS